ncbi:MAG: holo-ACP synthase [Candidatus Babeliales bacterium]
MILAIGIDSVECARFAHWHQYSLKCLSSIFTSEEIAYCLNNEKKQQERLAARFAAKEAFYKAWSTAFLQEKIPLRKIMRNTEVIKNPNGSAGLSIHLPEISIIVEKSQIKFHLSLTHTNHYATAFVILEKNTK